MAIDHRSDGAQTLIHRAAVRITMRIQRPSMLGMLLPKKERRLGYPTTP